MSAPKHLLDKSQGKFPLKPKHVIVIFCSVFLRLVYALQNASEWRFAFAQGCAVSLHGLDAGVGSRGELESRQWWSQDALGGSNGGHLS